MKVIKNLNNGKYYVSGAGFTGSVETATRLSEYDANKVVSCAKDMGVCAHIECAPCQDPYIIQNPDGGSWACYFVRKGDKKWNGGLGANKLNPSKRRFRTREEAWKHAERYVRIEGHMGCWLEYRYGEKVNAYINQVTGFTNPEIGKKRLCRTG